MKVSELFSKPSWRGDKTKLDMRRQWVRNHMPRGCDGFVAEDLDLIVRRWNPKDPDGELMIIETKTASGVFGHSKKKTLGLLHDMLGNQINAGRYLGFYLVYSEHEDWEKCDRIYVNGYGLTQEHFKKWLLGTFVVPSIHPMNVKEPLCNWKIDVSSAGPEAGHAE